MTKKLLYEQPNSELFVVRIERNILSFNSDNNETPVDDGDEDF